MTHDVTRDMTCDQYLARLSVASLDEIAAGDGDARAHAERCADCGRVTQLVVARERQRALAYDDLESRAPAHVPIDAGPTPRERHLDWLYALGASLALGFVVWVGASRVFPRSHAAGHAADHAAGMVEEAIFLRCLSAGEAAHLVRPLLRLEANTVLASAHARRVLTVRATPEQLQRVHATLDRYEADGSIACPTGPAPGSPTDPATPATDR